MNLNQVSQLRIISAACFIQIIFTKIFLVFIPIVEIEDVHFFKI